MAQWQSLLLLLTSLLLTPNATANSLPPPHEAVQCGVANKSGELPNARFERKGGVITRAKVVLQHDELTVPNVAQGRDLAKYDKVTLTEPARTVLQRQHSQVLAQARSFLFEHWRDHKYAYLKLTGSSVDATSTSHIFVEEDSKGRWRVAWRIVRDVGEVDDLPTYYGVQWVKPAPYGEHGAPLGTGESPDPTRHRLEFRDKCGDIEQTL